MKYLIAAALLVLATPALAQNPKTLSWKRASLVVTAQGISTGSGSPLFLPAIGASYSLTSQLSIAADCGHDFTYGGTISRVGLRAKIATVEEGIVGLGASYVRYDDLAVSHPESWEASLHGAWPLVRGKMALNGTKGRVLVSLVGSAARDPKNELSTYRLGARLHLLGGKPAPTVSQP